MNNDDLLKQIRQIVREEVNAEAEPLKKQLDQQGKKLDEHGKILVALSENIATVLTEQQQQRTDIRAVPAALDAAKEELRAEILTNRAEAKADNLRLRGKVDKVIENHETRLEELEKDAGITNRGKN